nr:MAG TPA: hypothetical protein [Caudoviricetes sp.]
MNKYCASLCLYFSIVHYSCIVTQFSEIGGETSDK